MWNDLKLEIDICTKCILEKTRINPIVGEGNKKAEILFVLDSISEEEDVKQKLLIDRNGKYFKKFLEYSKLDLKKCYFTTLTKCSSHNFFLILYSNILYFINFCSLFVNNFNFQMAFIFTLQNLIQRIISQLWRVIVLAYMH